MDSQDDRQRRLRCDEKIPRVAGQAFDYAMDNKFRFYRTKIILCTDERVVDIQDQKGDYDLSHRY